MPPLGTKKRSKEKTVNPKTYSYQEYSKININLKDYGNHLYFSIGGRCHGVKYYNFTKILSTNGDERNVALIRNNNSVWIHANASFGHE
eukprot:13127079-Ditylum_brightwellii.AAC.1